MKREFTGTIGKVKGEIKDPLPNGKPRKEITAEIVVEGVMSDDELLVLQSFEGTVTLEIPREAYEVLEVEVQSSNNGNGNND